MRSIPIGARVRIKTDRLISLPMGNLKLKGSVGTLIRVHAAAGEEQKPDTRMMLGGFAAHITLRRDEIEQVVKVERWEAVPE